MKINIFVSLVLFVFCTLSSAQNDIKVADIFNSGLKESEKQMLIIKQDSRIDTLVSRHILANARKNGIEGWRIQIYRGGHRTAQEEADKKIASFISDFPDCPVHKSFDKPNWFKVRVGDFRSREEAAMVFYKVLEKYPDAYLMRDVIEIKNTIR